MVFDPPKSSLSDSNNIDFVSLRSATTSRHSDFHISVATDFSRGISKQLPRKRKFSTEG